MIIRYLDPWGQGLLGGSRDLVGSCRVCEIWRAECLITLSLYIYTHTKNITLIKKGNKYIQCQYIYIYIHACISTYTNEPLPCLQNRKLRDATARMLRSPHSSFSPNPPYHHS